ncbi:hypothetical protein [uncultured Flavobacterium sp.]|uniref:hypothetical protein n=1 Tax=uncultured Flavobacterium sp. TaxID=165435 RepID=UPI0030815CE1
MKKKYVIIIIILGSLIFLFLYFKNEKIYTSKEYDSAGKLIGTNEYVIRNGKTIMHGKFVNYNEKGIKISEGQFVDDEPNGKCLYYYDNGKIETIQFKKNSKITLESINYNQKGLIDKYIMCDDFGKSVFTIYFDEKGVTKYDGNFQIETYQYKYAHKNQFNILNDQHLKVGDVLKYSYLIANIPNAKRSFKIDNLSVDNSKVNRTFKHVKPCELDVEEKIVKKGLNTIRSIVRYEFNDNVTPVFTDTISFNIHIK